MTKSSSIVVMLGVWTAGIAAAAAAYVVHEPPVPPADPRVSMAEMSAPGREEPIALVDSEEDVMMMPDDTIVASVPKPVQVPVRVAAVRELKCAAWVALAQGPSGAAVRYCE